MNSKKTKKNFRKKSKSKKKRITKKKYFKGGGAAMGAVKDQFKKMSGDDKCNLSIPYLSSFEKVSYSKKKLMGKLEEAQFLQKENPGFKNFFKKNLTKFCDKENGKYLKLSSNLFNCAKEPELFYEVMNDIFNLDIEVSGSLKTLYNKQKKSSPGLTIDDFYAQEKESRAEGISQFFVNVVFKSINDFESKYPPNVKDPMTIINLKQAFTTLFKNYSMSVDFKNETIDSIKKKILDKETVIGDYYSTRIFSIDDQQSINENKDKRSGNFIFMVIGGFLVTLILKSSIFEAPPELPGSIS